MYYEEHTEKDRIEFATITSVNVDNNYASDVKYVAYFTCSSRNENVDDKSASNVKYFACFTCSSRNDRGRMEIDHGLAVRRRGWSPCTRGACGCGQFLQLQKAPGTKIYFLCCYVSVNITPGI